MPSIVAAAELAVEKAALARRQALLTGDAARLAELLHDDFIFVHSTGAIDNKERTISAIDSKSHVYEKCDPLEIGILFSSEAIVALTGRTEYSIRIADMKREFVVINTDVWVRGPGATWCMRATHNTLAPVAGA